MNDRTFRLDFFIAVAAVLISVITAGTLFYQTHVIGDEFAATISAVPERGDHLRYGRRDDRSLQRRSRSRIGPVGYSTRRPEGPRRERLHQSAGARSRVTKTLLTRAGRHPSRIGRPRNDYDELDRAVVDASSGRIENAAENLIALQRAVTSDGQACRRA